ncbi:FAD/NAD(P)-binding domain-containing protein [Trichodelitschia bisporula]|uniref:FAD/NAD(P)-binding domain-containing protein n=1 Tax=Trichodelitschia bisporula TaxID=703511 RepID=A0A6G1I323_9PEZI|nr:FAD/NAD(P)-binding domain-containing protein [Trichodelitschia bisporula]
MSLDYDALVVGAGFGGIHQTYKLRELGLSVKTIDVAGDVGGTWFWNRYPGAMSDTHSPAYRFTFDLDDLKTYPWEHNYVKQPEVLAYLRHVVERHNLRQHFQFNTELLSATYAPETRTWTSVLSTGETLTTRYLVLALGLLSKTHWPSIPGLDTFKGTLVHSSRWPEGLDLNGKRVGVIGNGSTGVQIITDLAPKVASLVSYQRTPQHSVPTGYAPFTPAEREALNANWDAQIARVRESVSGFGFEEATTRWVDTPEAEREAVFERTWRLGNGFQFLFGAFADVATDRGANDAAAAFVVKKIGQLVKDPEKTRKLTPSGGYNRRPLCDSGYYESFNRPNVDVELLTENPIDAVTPKGIRTKDGREREFDAIICATGFDAVEGNFLRVQIKGASETLAEHWGRVGVTSYAGIAAAGFPNLFLVLGPAGPFVNLPAAIEAQSDFIADLIAKTEAGGARRVVEVREEAEREWAKVCERIGGGSIFRDTASWIFGSNIEGKKDAVRFYFAGLGAYRKALEEERARGYEAFRIAAVEGVEARL